MSQPDPDARFVVLRLLGAAAALTSGSLAGLALSQTWCAPTAAFEAVFATWAIGVALAGLACSVAAWQPPAAAGALACGLLLAAASSPFVASHARRVEDERAEGTRLALRELAAAVEAARATEGSLPGRTGSVASLVRALGIEEGELPTQDGWGGELRYEVEGGRYAFIARCRCSLPDAIEGAAAVGPRADMVLAEGLLLPWPGGARDRRP